MSSDAPAEERPVWRTGTLWGVLGVLLVLGAVACATFVYGIVGWWAGSPLDAGVAGGGAVGAFLAVLFMLGILYRVDRYRGVPHRRVELFE